MTIVQSPPGCSTEYSPQTSCDAARSATLFVVADTSSVNQTAALTSGGLRRPLHDLYYAPHGPELLIGFTPLVDRRASTRGIQV